MKISQYVRDYIDREWRAAPDAVAATADAGVIADEDAREIARDLAMGKVAGTLTAICEALLAECQRRADDEKCPRCGEYLINCACGGE